MEKLEFLNASLDNLVTFLAPTLSFLNCNLNDFFTHDLWENLLPDKLRNDIEKSPDKQALLHHYLKLAGSAVNVPSRNFSPDYFAEEPPRFEDLDLDELVHQIRQFSPLALNVSVSVNDFYLPENEDWESIKKNCGLNERKFDSLMSLKKEHEVKIMSQFVARLVKYINLERGKTESDDDGNSSTTLQNNDLTSTHSCHLNDSQNQGGIKHLIDLGSGKGYLSCFLTLLYRFNVLAIDGSSVNTLGSKKWMDNVHRIWKNVKKAMLEKNKLDLSSATMKCNGSFENMNDDGQISKLTQPPTIEHVNQSESDSPYELVLLKNLRLVVTDEINLDSGMKINFGINSNISEKEPQKYNTEGPGIEYGILGLHTCGALGSDSIKLFLNSKNAKFLCNVPCCHHFLLEKNYTINPTQTSGSESQRSQKWDFPLSQLLLDKQFNLGPGARMLSSHSPHKMIRSAVSGSELSTLDERWNVPKSVYYRSLLQVIIQRKLGHAKLEHRLGKKIGLMAPSFVNYVRLALIKLRLEDRIQITDEEIQDVEREFQTSQEKFYCFYLLRSIFAPLVDICVILDRLVYLIAQDTVQDAHLVQLFDPSISPRCQTIVAFKK